MWTLLKTPSYLFKLGNDLVLILSEWLRWRKNDFFCDFEIATEDAATCTHTAQRRELRKNKKGDSCSENGSLAAFGAYFFKTRSSIWDRKWSHRPSEHRTPHCFPLLRNELAHTASVFGSKTKRRFLTVTLQWHFKDCRGVLICKVTAVKNKQKNPQLKPHPYVSSSALKLWVAGGEVWRQRLNERFLNEAEL